MAATPLSTVSTVRARAGLRSCRYYVLVVLALIALLNTFDQAILGVTTPALQSEFRLADTQVGLLSSAFVLVYGLAALPMGYWVDRLSRRAIVGLGVVPPLRGSAAAIQQLSANVLGRTVGLTLIGLVADQAHDLRLALLVLPPAALVIAALSAAVGLRSMPQDVAAMDNQWQQLTQASSERC